MMATFVWLLFRPGSQLRREGLPDRAPSITQRSMLGPRRTVAFNQDWLAVGVALAVGAALRAVSWWLYRPARVAERSGG